jgi:hypothetical protein
VSVRGNVICGAVNKVLYAPQWQPLDNSNTPFLRNRNSTIRAELDAADLVSERRASLTMTDTKGVVRMKMLPHPKRNDVDAWDAGRIFTEGSRVDFILVGLHPHADTTLIMRFAPAEAAKLKLVVGGFEQTVDLSPQDAWVERSVEVPAHVVTGDTPTRLEMLEGRVLLYHLWGLQQ